MNSNYAYDLLQFSNILCVLILTCKYTLIKITKNYLFVQIFGKVNVWNKYIHQKYAYKHALTYFIKI